MWFLNKKTGLKWEITNNEIIKRLTKNPDYEEVKEKEKTEKAKK